jgi:hypothetical protein
MLKLKYDTQSMKAVILKAHFDGEKICLDEPFELTPEAKIWVTIVPGDSAEAERAAWLAASQASLARAYSDNEPDYSDAVLREQPPKE